MFVLQVRHRETVHRTHAHQRFWGRVFPIHVCLAFTPHLFSMYNYKHTRAAHGLLFVSTTPSPVCLCRTVWHFHGKPVDWRSTLLQIYAYMPKSCLYAPSSPGMGSGPFFPWPNATVLDLSLPDDTPRAHFCCRSGGPASHGKMTLSSRKRMARK